MGPSCLEIVFFLYYAVNRVAGKPITPGMVLHSSYICRCIYSPPYLLFYWLDGISFKVYISGLILPTETTSFHLSLTFVLMEKWKNISLYCMFIHWRHRGITRIYVSANAFHGVQVQIVKPLLKRQVQVKICFNKPSTEVHTEEISKNNVWRYKNLTSRNKISIKCWKTNKKKIVQKSTIQE